MDIPQRGPPPYVGGALIDRNGSEVLGRGGAPDRLTMDMVRRSGRTPCHANDLQLLPDAPGTPEPRWQAELLQAVPQYVPA